MSEPRASRPAPDWLGGEELLPWTWAEENLAAERNYVADPNRNTESLRRAGELYEAKYEYSADFLNFIVRPRIVYGWRSEDVKTATKWTFA
jgi:hypothetical protein